MLMLKECARVFRTSGADSNWDTQYDLGSAYLIPEELRNIHVTDVRITGRSMEEALTAVKKHVVQEKQGLITKVLGVQFQPVAATRRNRLGLWTMEGVSYEGDVLQIWIVLGDDAQLTLRRNDCENQPALQFCCKGGVIFYHEVV